MPVSSNSSADGIGPESRDDPVAAMLRARAIAVIGASGKPGTFGHNVVTHLIDTGYPGRVYPVNPRYEEVAALRCYSAVNDLPEVVDCAILAVADDKLEAALEAVAAAGVRSAVIFGAAVEQSAVGRPPLTDRLAAIARNAHMAICGGNCMGFLNFIDGIMVGGWPYKYPPPRGHVGLVSHSGSSYSAFALNARQLGMTHMISSGQELVTTCSDYLGFLLTQQETRVIGCILETIRDPERFLASLEAADRKGVPVVILKLGRSEHGKAMTRAHSGALAGSHAAYQAVFERYNVIGVHTLDELANTLELLACDRVPPTDAIALATDSGGERTMIVDIAADLGLRWAALSTDTTRVLAENLEAGLAPTNPVDLWGTGHDHERIARSCLKALADDAQVGQVVFASNMPSGRPLLHTWGRVAEAVHAGCAKPVMMLGNLSSAFDRDEAARLRRLGIPVLLGTASGLQAIGANAAWHRRRRERRTIRPSPIATEIIHRWQERLAGEEISLDTHDSLAFVADFGIPTVASRVAHNEGELRQAASTLRFPLVLKTLKRGIEHKFDVGGVVLGIHDPDALLMAWQELATRLGPAVLIQETSPPGVEMFLGLTRDPQWGPLVTIGLGGIFVEVMRDVVTFVPPVDADLALTYLHRLKGLSRLSGARGHEPVALGPLAHAIASFSAAAAVVGPALEEMDINPVIATGERALAVDALVVPRRRHPEAQVGVSA
jgi:acetate---CoA ligase (ADP-forming)